MKEKIFTSQKQSVTILHLVQVLAILVETPLQTEKFGSLQAIETRRSSILAWIQQDSELTKIKDFKTISLSPSYTLKRLPES